MHTLTLLGSLIAGPLLLLSVVAAPLEAQNAREPLIPPVGLDMSATDPSTRPGNDFWQYANGAWLARTAIPADKPYISEKEAMRDRTVAQLRGLIESVAASAPHEPTTVEGKVGAFYKSFMDAPRLEALGARPISTELAAIGAIRTPADVARLMGDFNAGFEGTRGIRRNLHRLLDRRRSQRPRTLRRHPVPERTLPAGSRLLPQSWLRRRKKGIPQLR
jgi:hypothetical protein